LKAIGTILLTFVILSQGLANLAICAYYNLNKASITEQYCVNKSKPKLHCDGKCYLAKQIKQSEDQEKKNRSTNRENDEIFSAAHSSIDVTYYSVYHTVGYLRAISTFMPSAPALAIDQPPCS
jgi:hypothetical protein